MTIQDIVAKEVSTAAKQVLEDTALTDDQKVAKIAGIHEQAQREVTRACVYVGGDPTAPLAHVARTLVDKLLSQKKHYKRRK